MYIVDYRTNIICKHKEGATIKMSKTDSKPFACTSEGCEMTFTNEDHLNIHQKKHDMVLNLGLTCKANAFADQTPTPTRFIRNCEEVGLFQDLQNVNPFEETFRKAIEHTKNGGSHVPEPASDDTLHTPHIFPHITEENIDKFRRTASDEPQPKEFSISNVPTINDDLNSRESSLNKISNEVIDLTVGVDEAQVREGNSASETNISSASSGNSLDILNYVGLTSVSASTKSQVKEKIKVALQNKKQEAPSKLDKKKDVVVPEKCSLILPKRPRKRIGPKCKLKSLESATIQAKTTLSFYDKNLSETEKRRAMNRMAQMRSRQRKKIWLDELEAEITKLKAENRGISLENQHLKDENMLLKAILLNHNNCSLSSLEEVPGLLNAYRLRQTQKGTGLPTTVPKPPVPINLAPIVVQNSSSLTSAPQVKSEPKIILTPFGNANCKRLIEDGKILPKLITKPSVVSTPHKIDGTSDSIIIFLE